MKKLSAKKIIAGTVISMGLVIPLTATNNGALLSQPQTVQAATKKITLKHNAYLYNYRGRRVGRRKLYRHHTYTYYSIKRIHGKKYYRVGKNSYIKASNVLTKKHTNKAKTPSNLIPETNSKLSLNTSGLGTPKFQVSIDKTNADIYSTFHAIPHGSWIGTLKLDGTYNVYAEENDMYEIGNGQWIKSGIAEVISGNSSSSNQTTKENTKKSSDSNTSAKPSSTPASKPQNTKKPAKPHKNAKVNPSEADLQDAANRFLAMVNKDRAELGIKPLTLNAHLSEEAKQRSVHDAD
ncbi:MAG: SLAP domain-containing protein, partial [Lactobacillus sp.]|nr:SLAP domain-containing protein [Lactobacillus sp.]